MLLNKTLWLTVTHTFMGNRPKLAHWSKWFSITLRTCFCSLLTSNWEVSTACSLNNFINFTQTTQNFVINLYIEAIETKLSNGKHTLRVFTENFKKIVGKTLFGCFIYVFVSIFSTSWHFERVMLWLTVMHTFIVNEPKLAHWSKWICITHLKCFCS